MAEIDSQLLWNPFREIRDEQKAMRGDMNVMSNDLRSIKGHMASFMTKEVVQDTRIAEIIARLERVEKRLDLREAE
jgi:argininosuccinate lyase